MEAPGTEDNRPAARDFAVSAALYLAGKDREYE